MKILPHEKYPLSSSLHLLQMCLGYMHVTCTCLVSQCPGSEDDSDEREVPPAEGEGSLHPCRRSCDTSTYHVISNTCHTVGFSQWYIAVIEDQAADHVTEVDVM